MLRLRNTALLLALLFVALFSTGASSEEVSQKDGTLVVLVTLGDIKNSPAEHVYIEAHGYVPKLLAAKSIVLKMARPGRYEASLPPAVYDVFVSEGDSTPRCRRVLVNPGITGYWTLKLENDEVYLDK